MWVDPAGQVAGDSLAADRHPHLTGALANGGAALIGELVSCDGDQETGGRLPSGGAGHGQPAR